jgi:hypothetical protein
MIAILVLKNSDRVMANLPLLFESQRYRKIQKIKSIRNLENAIKLIGAWVAREPWFTGSQTLCEPVNHGSHVTHSPTNNKRYFL